MCKQIPLVDVGNTYTQDTIKVYLNYSNNDDLFKFMNNLIKTIYTDNCISYNVKHNLVLQLKCVKDELNYRLNKSYDYQKLKGWI